MYVHIVVEDRVLIVVHVQQSLRVVYAEVLEVQQTMRIVFAHELDESGRAYGESLRICAMIELNLSTNLS